MPERPFYQPGASSVEGLPLMLQMFHNHPLIMLKPHWHAQVEVNFIVRGAVHYRMNDHEISLAAGDMCLFWGGLPHQMDDASDDAIYAGAHLPLVHFFRLHLPADVRHRLMTGATLSPAQPTHPTSTTSSAGTVMRAQATLPRPSTRSTNCCCGWSGCGSNPTASCPVPGARMPANPFDQQSSRNVGPMCDFIAENFLYEIDCVDIAAAADIHPKYAMSVFKKSTGMTLNEYVNLLQTQLRAGAADERGRQRPPRRDGQRFRLAQRLQQIVPQAGRHVAVGFPEDFGKGLGLTFAIFVRRFSGRRR